MKPLKFWKQYPGSSIVNDWYEWFYPILILFREIYATHPQLIRKTNCQTERSVLKTALKIFPHWYSHYPILDEKDMKKGKKTQTN